MPSRKDPLPVYFTSLELENVRCFGKGPELDLVDDYDGGPARWTLLLGDNGVGKTTLLQCLAWTRPVPRLPPGTTGGKSSRGHNEDDEPAPLVKGPLEPALSGEENEVLEALLRLGTEYELKLKGEMCQGRELRSTNGNRKGSSRKKGEKIRTRIKIFYSKKRALTDIDLKGNTRIETIGEYQEPFIVVYGANRQLGFQNLSDLDDPVSSERLSHITWLYDAEEILSRMDHAAAKKGAKSKEHSRLEKLKELLAKVLPNINGADDIKIFAPDILNLPTEQSGVRFKTFSGLVPLQALSLGYRTTLSWTVDFAWRLFRRYPKSPDPLSEPAIVLIDEIDLHLHPLWQLTIIDDLTQLFPRTQFVATAHSPLMVQVAATANLAVIKKENDGVEIINDPDVIRSWRVDQILTSGLFDVPYSRDKQTEGFFKEREKLLDKQSLSRAEQARLRYLDQRLARLPIAPNPEDQKAIDLIRKAASLLKRQTRTTQ
jgi:AAA domain, putative AbiEii toxin, Type IV TA system